MSILKVLFLLSFVIGVQPLFLTQPKAEVAQDRPNSSQSASAVYLRRWVEDNFVFFKDAAGVSKLFVRHEPVKVFLAPSDFAAKDEALRLIADLSLIWKLPPYEITSREVSLAIIVDSPINVGDKPNPELWSRYGFTNEMYNIVVEHGGWSGGCGAYSFGNQQGGIGLTIVFADSKSPSSQVRNCVIDGVIHGFGLRQNSKLLIHADDGYLQFLSLGRALKDCQDRLGATLGAMSEAEQKPKYVDCATDYLSKM